MTRRKAFVSIIDDSVNDDQYNIDKITSFCNYCESLGFYHKLGPRIYPNNKDQPIPHDHNLFLQCYNCGRIENRVHSKQLNEIAPIVDPPDNIHDAVNNVTVLSANSGGPTHRRSREIIDSIKKTRPGANRGKEYVDIDSDIRSQLQKGKKLVSYSSTNDEFEG